jgi:hypothetical protein
VGGLSLSSCPPISIITVRRMVSCQCIIIIIIIIILHTSSPLDNSPQRATLWRRKGHLTCPLLAVLIRLVLIPSPWDHRTEAGRLGGVISPRYLLQVKSACTVAPPSAQWRRQSANGIGYHCSRQWERRFGLLWVLGSANGASIHSSIHSFIHPPGRRDTMARYTTRGRKLVQRPCFLLLSPLLFLPQASCSSAAVTDS